MSIFIADSLITKSQCDSISDKFDGLCIDDPNQYGYKHVPGMTVENGIVVGLPLLSDIANSISNQVLSVANHVFRKNLKLISFGYVQMHTGSNNGLHADSVQSDGSPYPDGKIVEYSAILYLNDMDSDFSGGSISFPKQGVSVRPKAGNAIIFKGDTDHVHSVKTVTSGVRKTIILFFQDC